MSPDETLMAPDAIIVWQVLSVLRATAPLLSRRQPDRVQCEALALCRRLAYLDPDTVWMVFAGLVPPAECWAARPPDGCARAAPATLLLPTVTAADAAHNARRVLDSVVTADRHARQSYLSKET